MNLLWIAPAKQQIAEFVRTATTIKAPWRVAAMSVKPIHLSRRPPCVYAACLLLCSPDLLLRTHTYYQHPNSDRLFPGHVYTRLVLHEPFALNARSSTLPHFDQSNLPMSKPRSVNTRNTMLALPLGCAFTRVPLNAPEQ